MLFNRRNISRVPNTTGYYYLNGKRGNHLYVGVSKHLRHRIESYNERDDYNAHPTKRGLHNKIIGFSYHTTHSLKQAQRIEHKAKTDLKFNFL